RRSGTRRRARARRRGRARRALPVSAARVRLAPPARRAPVGHPRAGRPDARARRDRARLPLTPGLPRRVPPADDRRPRSVRHAPRTNRGPRTARRDPRSPGAGIGRAEPGRPYFRPPSFKTGHEALVTMKRLFIVDGHSQIFRAYHAVGYLSTSKGISTQAVL